MNLETFKASIAADTPPLQQAVPCKPLWYDAKGQWDKAHELAQQEPDPIGAWIHAYLPRVEGDENNADYWCKRADKPHCKGELSVEWGEISSALLAGD